MTTFEHEIRRSLPRLRLFGHVNNAVYLTYLEQARFAHWQRLTGRPDPRKSSSRASSAITGPGDVGDRLVVRLKVAAVGNTSFTFEYEIANGGTRAVVATRGRCRRCTTDTAGARCRSPTMSGHAWRDESSVAYCLLADQPEPVMVLPLTRPEGTLSFPAANVISSPLILPPVIGVEPRVPEIT